MGGALVPVERGARNLAVWRDHPRDAVLGINEEALGCKNGFVTTGKEMGAREVRSWKNRKNFDALT